jgi:hypothetical protein
MTINKFYQNNVKHFSPAHPTTTHKRIHLLNSEILHPKFNHYINTGNKFILKQGESVVVVLCNLPFTLHNTENPCCLVYRYPKRTSHIDGLLVTNSGTNNFIMHAPHRTSLHSLLKFPDVRIRYISWTKKPI